MYAYALGYSMLFYTSLNMTQLFNRTIQDNSGTFDFDFESFGNTDYQNIK